MFPSSYFSDSYFPVNYFSFVVFVLPDQYMVYDIGGNNAANSGLQLINIGT